MVNLIQQWQSINEKTKNSEVAQFTDGCLRWSSGFARPLKKKALMPVKE